ncbi:hypothetical protein ACIRQY_34655 [Streptomyces sp. NPDC101490]|uniref:hypothetical protein n=1 Tax=Streptomyces sp. NPDC101490 TaxID=3366143 RepID=UPI0038053713
MPSTTPTSGRQIDFLCFNASPRLVRAVDTCGLPVADGALLFTPVTALLGEHLRHPGPITCEEASQLARLLSTACLLLIASVDPTSGSKEAD